MDFLWVMSLLIFSLPEIYYFPSKPIFSGPISINTSEKANRRFARYVALLNVCVILLNTICRTLFVHTNIRRDRQTHTQITNAQINTCERNRRRAQTRAPLVCLPPACGAPGEEQVNEADGGMKEKSKCPYQKSTSFRATKRHDDAFLTLCDREMHMHEVSNFWSQTK